MKKISRSKIITWSIILLVVLAVVAVVVVNSINARKTANADLQTATLEKGDLTAIVGATGTVRANQSAILSWQTSGRIEAIKVTTGDVVAINEELASLAQSTLSQSIILARSDLVTAQRNLDDLLNSTSATAQAQLNLANAQEEYDKVRWYAVYPGTARETNQNVIDAAQAAVVLAQDKVEKAEDNYENLKNEDDDDPFKASALNALANARKELDQAKLNLQHYTGVPNEQEVSISQAEIAVALATMEDAQREWDRLKDGPDAADIEAAQARVEAIEATINMAKLTAPFSGTITQAEGMVGDLVSPGSNAFRIDDLTKMFVDVYVPEVDINRIKVGQEVTLTFDAISLVEYQGRVTEVAQVGTTSAGSVDFKVTLEVLNPDEQVKPGMTAAVNIVVSNVKDALIVPNRAVRSVDGQFVVYILKNDIPTKVEIVIGSSSDTYSEVLSGDIQVGDTIILNPSTSLTDMMSSMGGGPF